MQKENFEHKQHALSTIIEYKRKKGSWNILNDIAYKAWISTRPYRITLDISCVTLKDIISLLKKQPFSMVMRVSRDIKEHISSNYETRITIHQDPHKIKTSKQNERISGQTFWHIIHVQKQGPWNIKSVRAYNQEATKNWSFLWPINVNSSSTCSRKHEEITWNCVQT